METTSKLSFEIKFKPIVLAIKRLIDIIGSVFGIIMSFPIMLIISILIKIDSEGPIIFIQERVGKDGKVFYIYKFRSMVNDAEDKLKEIINIYELEEPVYKIKNDPRVTQVGRVLRWTSFDELPQFVNVLKGEMSLVGPRPEASWLVERYTPEQRVRFIMKPGITGPVQINGTPELPLNARIDLEFAYMKNYCLIKDFEIMIKTIPSIFRKDGCY